MDNLEQLTVMAKLLDKLVERRFAEIEIPQGERGLPGRNGNHFNLEDHADSIKEFVLEITPRYLNLTSAELESLKGEQGQPGKDGKNFNFIDHEDSINQIVQDYIRSIQDDFKLRFSDLSEEDLLSLKGEKGESGESFNFEQEKIGLTEILSDLVKDSIDELRLHFSDLTQEEKESLSLKFSDLTAEQKEELRGFKGKDGKSFTFEDFTEDQLASLKGSDGSDGKDFTWEDLTDEQKESLRGFKGKDGKSFTFEDFTEDQIALLKGKDGEPGKNFTWEDLNDEQREELRGYKGRDGKSLTFADLTDDQLDMLVPRFENFSEEQVDRIKLKFSDLTDDEKEELKLRFEDLTDLQIRMITGKRGQKGARGEDGRDFTFEDFTPEQLELIRGEKGRDGLSIMGPQGVQGERGFSIKGDKGDPGKDAPEIVDIEVDQHKDEFSLVFKFSDNTEIETDKITLPKGKDNHYVAGGGDSSGGGGGGSSAQTEYFDEGVSLGTASKLDVQGPGVKVELQGDTIVLTVDPSDVDTNTTDLKVFSGATEIVETDELVFDDTDFTVTDVGGQAVVTVNFPADNNTTDLEIYKDGVLFSTTEKLDFEGDEFILTQDVDGRTIVTLDLPPSIAGSVGISDEDIEITNAATKINFIGEFVTVRPRTPMSEWAFLSDIVPNLLDYAGDDNTVEEVDVFIDVPDPSVLRNNNCMPDVYVGSFVIVNNSGLILNGLADAYENANVLGVVERKNSITNCDVRIFGRSLDIFTGLDTSLDYFLSATQPGEISSSPPNDPGQIILRLGQAFSSESFVLSKGERVVKG